MRTLFAAIVAACGLTTAAEAAPLPTGNSGVASLYPGDAGLANDPSVLWFDNFEGYSGVSSLWGAYQNFYQQSNFRLATEAADVFRGQKSLQITQPNVSTSQYNALTKGIAPQDTVFVRFYTKLDAGFSFSAGSAVHNGVNISAGYSGPGAVPNGRDFFYVGLENTTYRGEPQPGYTHAYVYHPEQRSGYGDHWYSEGLVFPGGTQGNFGAGFVPMPPRIAERGRWYCVELMVRANTPGARDGRVAAWIDGVLIADWQNLRFRDTSTLKIDRVELVLGAPQNTDGADRVWFDNLAIATGYIGPMAGTGVPETPRLGLSVSPGSIAENGGAATGTVTRSGSTAGGLTVALASSDTSEATVPASVTIAAGSSRATFAVRGVNDATVDGTQVVTLRATAPGATEATARLDVTDDDAPPPPPPLAGPETIFAGVTAAGAYDGQPWVLGTVFQSSRPGRITAVRVYAVAGESGSHTFRLWDNLTGRQVGATGTFAATGAGWIQYNLPQAIAIREGVRYTVAVTTGGDARKYYAAAVGALARGGSNGASLSYPANAGVFGASLTQRPTQVWNATNYLRDVVFVPD
jgi:hypothetical protein